MAIYRAQVSFGADSALPRDRVVITPHFSVGEGIVWGGAETQALAQDLADAIADDWLTTPAREISVKIYNAQGGPPHYPLGEALRNGGQYPVTQMPRELALCLSFYSERNAQRRRGRLYLPAFLLAELPDIGHNRPQGVVRARPGVLAGLLQSLGGTNVDWCVFSRVANAAYPVTNWWVDDEWDVQRRRGLRPTTREGGTTSEG